MYICIHIYVIFAIINTPGCYSKDLRLKSIISFRSFGAIILHHQLDGSNPINNRRNQRSTGAGFGGPIHRRITGWW